MASAWWVPWRSRPTPWRLSHPSAHCREQAFPFLVFILAEDGEGRGGGVETGRKGFLSGWCLCWQRAGPRLPRGHTGRGPPRPLTAGLQAPPSGLVGTVAPGGMLAVGAPLWASSLRGTQVSLGGMSCPSHSGSFCLLGEAPGNQGAQGGARNGPLQTAPVPPLESP